MSPLAMITIQFEIKKIQPSDGTLFHDFQDYTNQTNKYRSNYLRVAKELIVALRKILVIDARLFESCRGVTRVFS